MVDPEGYLHDEESEDVLDLDHTEVLNLLDEVPDPDLFRASELSSGFCEDFEARLDALEDLDNTITDEEIEAILADEYMGG